MLFFCKTNPVKPGCEGGECDDNKYEVTFSAGENGTITASVDGAAIESGAEVAHGKTVVFTASANSGYTVKEWTLNGNAAGGNTVSFTIGELTADAAVTVAFETCTGEECNTYPVTFSAGPNGTIAALVDGAAITSGAEVAHGNTVVFTASANSGYIVKEWTLDGTAVDGNKTPTFMIDGLTAAAAVTVAFETCVGEGCKVVDNLGIPKAIVVTFGSEVDVSNPIEESVTVDVSGGHIVIKSTARVAGGIDVVLSGTTSDGSFKAYASDLSEGNGMEIRLHLNGVDITNPKGPAISFPRGKNIDSVSVRMLKVNILSDAERDYDLSSLPAEESAKGTFFSESAVIFFGSGGLQVTSKSTRPAAGGERGRHAIVVDHHFTMREGNVVIHGSTNDGIHTNRRITITGGKLQITSAGDAIQNEHNYPILIGGNADLTLRTSGIKSHGIACDSNHVTIEGNAKVNIRVDGDGSKGIRSRRDVEIKGGIVDIDTRGNIDITPGTAEDEDGTSTAAGVRAHEEFKMSGGDLKIRSRGENARGINVNGNVLITGGVFNIQSIGNCIKSDGNLNIQGLSGTGLIESFDKKAININGTYTRGAGVNIDMDNYCDWCNWR